MASDNPTSEVAPDLISVIMPVRNGATFVGIQVQALLGQSYPWDWELIVVDNGSTDGSADVVEAALAAGSAPRLKRATVSRFVERFGHASPRNHGAAISSGSWLVFCDADDVVAPDWLERLVSCRQTNTITASTVVPFVEGEDPDVAEGTPGKPQEQLFGVPVVHTGGMLVRRADFDQLGGFDSDFDRGGADVDFSIRAYAAGMKATTAIGAVYRVRTRVGSGSAVSQAYRYGRSRVRLFARHCDVVPENPSEWSLLFGRLRDVIRRAPELLDPARRTGYLRMVSNVSARLIWSARLRVRYF